SGAFAATRVSEENAVGAQVLIREVLNQKLLGVQDDIWGPYLTKALEGSGELGEYVEIRDFYCEPDLNIRNCDISLETDDENNHAINQFDLHVSVFQGTVKSAHVE